MVAEQLRWKASVGFNYAWDRGEQPGYSNGTATFLAVSNDSRVLNWTLSGRHLWRHDQIGLNYAGNFSQYPGGASLTSLTGMNNSLNFDYGHAFSRRVSFQLVESLQSFSQNYSLENPALASTGTSVANIDLATSPSVQLVNNSFRQSSTSLSMTFQQSRRLSYNISITGFLNAQSTAGLQGMTGRQASGDVNYRLTRKATVGTYYSYTSYLYDKHVAQADSHTVGLIYSYALNGHTQLQTRVGATQIESLGYETIPLDPGLAFVLGQSSTTINAYARHWTSDVSAQLSRQFRGQRTASIAYAHGQSPGNGLLLTSVQQTVTAGYTMSFFRRRLPLSTGVVYSTLNATGQSSLSYYRSEMAYLGTSRSIGHGLSATMSVNYSRYEISTSPAMQHDIRISVGFLWSPPPDALRFF